MNANVQMQFHCVCIDIKTEITILELSELSGEGVVLYAFYELVCKLNKCYSALACFRITLC